LELVEAIQGDALATAPRAAPAAVMPKIALTASVMGKGAAMRSKKANPIVMSQEANFAAKL
jgi:hypothetical protein